jgi:hypothetical protein
MNKRQNCQTCYRNEIKCSEANVKTTRARLNTAFFYTLYCYTPKALPLWERFTAISTIEKRRRSETSPAEAKGMATTKNELKFEEGEWVEVLSEEEIRSTLNSESYLDGFHFMDEMVEFCGKKYRVYKSVKKLKLESTGELRIITRPTYCLEGVFCNGRFHDGCDRSCFCLWRAEWLRRSSP